MAPLTPFTLPLPLNAPPPGYDWEEREVSSQSATSVFDRIDERDVFLGVRRCVVCGDADAASLDRCHIIIAPDLQLWTDLLVRGWIPDQAKEDPKHEPRNGLVLCAAHHRKFDRYGYFIRYHHQTRKFVLVNYSEDPMLVKYHGKAIALDIRDQHAPFPSLFIIHECRVCGFHPFKTAAPEVPDNPLWARWLLFNVTVLGYSEARQSA